MKTRSVLECGGCDTAFKPVGRGTFLTPLMIIHRRESGGVLRLPPQSKTSRLWLIAFCFLLSAFGRQGKAIPLTGIKFPAAAERAPMANTPSAAPSASMTRAGR